MSIMSMRDIPFSGGDFMRFIGRAFELRELEEEYEKGIFALSVIYGRRRVGKTYLIKEFLKRKMLMLGLSEAISETRKFFATIE